ncbi:MAG: DNA-3-methyladenine glycosylase I [Magnetospiraceae bacterium]
MRSFAEIRAISADRKPDLDTYLAAQSQPKSPAEIADIADDRWLSCMTRCIFQAGFNWKVVEAKWPGFEDAFEGFDVHRCAMLSADDIGKLASDTRVIRNGSKLASVPVNARFILDLARDHGGAGKAFGSWPGEKYIDLLALLKQRGTRLGGNTGPYLLRLMGVDSFILSKDVTARLIAEGVIDKPATSKKAMVAVQAAFNSWHQESGKSFTEISRTLALSIG